MTPERPLHLSSPLPRTSWTRQGWPCSMPSRSWRSGRLYIIISNLDEERGSRLQYRDIPRDNSIVVVLPRIECLAPPRENG